MSQLIVADSSPLIALLNIGRLELLKKLFTEIVVPPMVATEVTRGEVVNSLWFSLQQEGFIRVMALTDDPRLPLLRLQLDPGESEAILLADQLQLPLLIDERAGRSMAKTLGLQIRGLVGVLYALRQAGHLSLEEMPEVVDALERVHFRLSTGLKQLLLAS